MSPIRYAQLTLNSVALVPSVVFCLQMPQRLLSLPLFFRVLIIATLFFLAVPSISWTNYRRSRTTLLALSWEFLKRITFLLILLLFIGCPLIHGYSTNSLLSVIICLNSTAPNYLTEPLRIYKRTRQLRLFSDTSILCIPSVRTHSLGQRSFSYAAPAFWNTLPYEIRSSNTISFFSSSLRGQSLQEYLPVSYTHLTLPTRRTV